MSLRIARRALWILVPMTLLAFSGCGRRGSLIDTPAASSGDPRTPRPPSTPRGAAARPPAGTSCMGREDCPTDQVCVERTCRYRDTSVAGEILATAARAEVEAGDWQGAMRSYEQSIEHFEAAHAAVPPDILCASASLILRTATDAESRERGARRADQCFRASLPGSAERDEVRRAVARLRFEGLDTALFDRMEPADRFFTQEPSRPTVDALAIDVEVPESEDATVALVRDQLAEEGARRAIAECFVQDWESRHERSASASLVLRYSTRLHDMGTYDVYEPTITVEKTTVAEDGFEPCVANALSGVLTAPRAGRVVSWQTPMSIVAHVQ